MDALASMETRVQLLQQQIKETEDHLRDLKYQLEKAVHPVDAGQLPDHNDRINDITIPFYLRLRQDDENDGSRFLSTPQLGRAPRLPLEDHEYKRYGRQLIIPEIGLPGQTNLKNVKVLIVGLGGLGCPAAAYLTGAGVGEIGLVDGDTVESSNLHRQLAHSTDRVGMMKVDSAYEYLTS